MRPEWKNLGSVFSAEVTLRVRGKSRPIILVTGCFDLLHRGHVELINYARTVAGGDLIVGVNSDDSIRRLKGKKRPICPLADRVYMLCNLAAVDGVFCFYGERVVEVLNEIRPAYWVKGPDYTLKTLDKYEVRMAKKIGTKIVIAERRGDWSTTGILKRI